MKSKFVIISVVLIFVSQLVGGIMPVTSAPLRETQVERYLPANDPKEPGGEAVEAEIKSAIFSAVADRGYGWGATTYQLQLDNLEISTDGDWAKAWLVYYDPDLGIIIPTEPGVVVAHQVDDEWIVLLPGDPGWMTALEQAPDVLITSAETVLYQTQRENETRDFSTEALSGFHLPWEKGKTVNLTASVSHDEWITSGNAHYAFDFAVYQTMWPIHAAKSGYIYTFRDDIPDGTEEEPNFIVIRMPYGSVGEADDLYQIYLHLAQDSIPPEFKIVGTPVAQGQYIGTADDTGMSTGHHLHFQVGGIPYWPEDNPYWNKALDIIFEEVNIYGGRPRLKEEYDVEICGGYCIYGRTAYISDNEQVGDLVSPYGDLSGIDTGAIITQPTVTLNGWGKDDDSGLDYGQLVANYGGLWHEVGAPFNPSFTYTWNLCAENAVVPDGAVSIALRLYDKAGNWEPIAGLTHFTKDFSCPIPPPSCIPTSDQVTLFEDIDYKGGCAKLGPGGYPDGTYLVVLGSGDTASIMVGENVAATLFSENSYLGHSETLEGNDSYLVDNLISADTLSSLVVTWRDQLPLKPRLVAPATGQVFKYGDFVPLSWRNGQGALEYQVSLYSTATGQMNFGWQEATFLFVDSLPPGEYSWKVKANNTYGESYFSDIYDFTIEPAGALIEPISAPYTNNFDSSTTGWTANGFWTLKSGLGVSGTAAWWYQGTDGDYSDGTTNWGSLTSPPINIPMEGYSLSFQYRYETESSYTWWDQRWVQISVDGRPFTNLYQLSEDPRIPELFEETWLTNPVTDLLEYVGHAIRVRFLFATMDAAINEHDGWGIDNFSITKPTPITCTDLRLDDTWADASTLVYDAGLAIDGEICPGGDWDYYKFNGKQGDRIVVDIDANDVGSPLDPYVILYDHDGVSVLAEDDDEVLGKRRDPLLGYTLSQDGTYYFKVRAWNHPSVGDSSYDYQVRLFSDEDDPTASIEYPESGQFQPDSPFTIQAFVNDATDQISRVEFYWHSTNWLVAPWTLLGTDWDGGDGWSMVFDPSGESEGIGAAVFVIAYDRAGNLTGAVSWNLGIDKTEPYTNLSYIEKVQISNAFLLRWSGSDNLSGIDYYQVQKQVDGSIWENDPGTIDGSETQRWMVTDVSHVYGFRMRGVDNSGNTEAFPTTAEITATVPSAYVLCSSPDPFDTGSNDNTPGKASFLETGSSQEHNFCNPLVASFQDDLDWVRFEVHQGQRYLIQAFPLVEQAAVVLKLFAGDGTTLLESISPKGFGWFTQLEWVSDRDGTVYLQMSHPDGRVIGSRVAYQIMVTEGFEQFLPQVCK